MTIDSLDALNLAFEATELEDITKTFQNKDEIPTSPWIQDTFKPTGVEVVREPIDLRHHRILARVSKTEVKGGASPG